MEFFVSFFILLVVPSIAQLEGDDPILSAHHKGINSKICGHGWQKSYMELHEKILNGLSPNRFLVSTSDFQGASDRMVGLMTEFYAALMSNRAFQVHAWKEVEGFDTALEEASVKWKMLPKQKHVVESLLNSTKDHVNGTTSQADTMALIYHDGFPLFSDNFDKYAEPIIFGPTPTILFESNRGNVYHLIKDSNHSTFFENIGIHPLFGAYCAFHFLFRPRPEVLALAYPYSKHLASKHAIKIGIQIRTGDQAFSEHLHGLQDSPYYRNFFECASFLEQVHGNHGKRQVIWYLMSDSIKLRRDAKEKYGDKLITDVSQPALHFMYGNKTLGMQLIMAEVSLCMTQ